MQGSDWGGLTGSHVGGETTLYVATSVATARILSGLWRIWKNAEVTYPVAPAAPRSANSNLWLSDTLSNTAIGWCVV